MRRLVERRRACGEAGFTLVEVTLTLLILSVVMMVAFNFLDRASLLTFRADAHARGEDQVQQALRLLTEHTRGALPLGDPCTSTTDTPPGTTSGLTQGILPAGYANCLQFTVPRTKVGLDTCAKTSFVYALVPVTNSVGTLTNTYLVENRRETTGTGSAGACVTGTWRSRRVLLDKVDNTAAQPLFTYYASDATPVAVTNTAGVKAASSIKVTLAHKYSKKAPALVLTSNVALRNNISR